MIENTACNETCIEFEEVKLDDISALEETAAPGWVLGFTCYPGFGWACF